MEKVVAPALVAAGLLVGVVAVAPRFVDGVLMGSAPVCSTAQDDDCLDEVDVVVAQRVHGIRKDLGPIRWHLERGDGGDELILRAPWLGEELTVGSHATLQLWEGDPIALRDGSEVVHSLAWGTNRWILWGWAALAILLAGLTLLYHSLKPDPDDDAEPVDGVAAAVALCLATAVAAAPMYALYSAGGWYGAVVVIGVWAWLSVPLMIRGRRRRVTEGSRSRGLG